MPSPVLALFWLLLSKTPEPLIFLGLICVLILPQMLKQVRKIITDYRKENTKRMAMTNQNSPSNQTESPPRSDDDPSQLNPER